MSCDACALALARVAHQLGQLRSEVSNLRKELRQFGVARAAGDESALIEAVHAAMDDYAFVTAELLARALKPDAAGFGLAALLDDKPVRSVGKALARAANRRTADGLVLQRVGVDRAGAVWCVSRV